MTPRRAFFLAFTFIGLGSLVAGADAQQVGLGAPRQFDGGSTIAALAVGDFDKDGLIDIADVATPHTLNVRRKDPSTPGTPYASQTYRVETLDIAGSVTDMAVGPLLYGSSYPDFVLAAGGSLVVVTNAGPGAAPNDQLQLAAQTPLSAGPGTILDHVRIANWDGVGGADLVATGFDGSNHGILAVFLNDYGGTRGAFGPATVTILTHPVFGLAVADFTFDGVGDAAVAYRADDAVGVLSGDGAGGAVNETILSVPFHPEGLAVGQFDPTLPYSHPDLVIAGSGRSQDDTKNEIQYAVAQNLTTIHTKNPSFASPTTFRLSGVAGVDRILPTDVSVVDMDADGLPEILVADYLNGSVAVASPIPTFAAGIVTSWGAPTVNDFQCNAQPIHVAHASLVGSSFVDVVTGNDGGNGVNALIGAPPSTPLHPATDLRMQLGTGDAAHPKYAALAGGASVKNGSDCRFVCRDANESAPGLRIRVQSSATPDDESSWTDLAGGGDMAQDIATGDFVLYQQSFPIGAEYFRTVSSAPGAADGIDRDSPESNSATRYVGPFTIQGGQPARLLLFTSIRRPDGSVPTTTHPGETLRVSLAFRNEGDVAVTADLWGQVPPGCAVVAPNGGKPRLPWLVWKGVVVPGRSGDVVRSFDVTVGGASTIGTVVESRYSGIGPKLKLTFDKTGKLKAPSKGGVVGSVNDSVPVVPDLEATITPNLTSQHVGGDVVLKISITNNTTSAMTNVRFVERLRGDVEGLGGSYLDADDFVLPGAPDVDASGAVFTFTFASIAAGGTAKAELLVRSTWDHAPSGTIAISDYELSGQDGQGAAAVVDPKPTPVAVAIDAPATDVAPRLELSAGASSPDHPDPYVSSTYGELPFAYNGEQVQYYFFFQNTGVVTADHVLLHAFVPPGADLDTTSYASAVAFLVTAPVPASGVTSVPGPTDVTVDFGNIPADGVIRSFGFKARYRDVGAAGAAAPGALLTTQFASLTSSSFQWPSFMRPDQVRVLVAEPVKFEVTKTVTHSGLSMGDSMTLTYVVKVVGPVGARSVTAAFGWPKYESCGAATLDGATVTGAVGKGVCTYDLGDFAKGQSKELAVTVQLATVPPPTVDLINTLSVAGVAAAKASGGGTPSITLDVETTNVCDPSRACLFLAAAVHALGELNVDGGTNYLIVVGNTSDQTAHGVVLTAALPQGTDVSANVPPTGGAVANSKKRTVTWRLGDVAAHSATSVSLPIATGAPLGLGDSIVQEISVSATDAPTKVSGRLATTMFDVDDLYGAAAGRRALLVNGVAYQPGSNSGVDAAFSAMNADTLNVQIRGADFTKFADDVVVIPLGAGNVLAFGAGAKVFAAPGAADAASLTGDVRLHHGTDLFHFVSGAESSIRVVINGCSTISTTHDALDHVVDLLPCKVATIVSNGGANQVDRLGIHLISNQNGSLSGSIAPAAGADVLYQGGGSVIAAGGGSVIAAGGGNAASVAGGALAAKGLASVALVTPSMVIASGGGNVISQGGGNVISQGGGNVTPKGGAEVISQGGGNATSTVGAGVISQGGGNLVSTNGGNVISQGGGNVISQGGGNVIAPGGGN